VPIADPNNKPETGENILSGQIEPLFMKTKNEPIPKQ
jgi:hypothetical protein